ncbi:MAG: hypothetical protein U0T81_10330 [Saprospiraceae bacterium]
MLRIRQPKLPKRRSKRKSNYLKKTRRPPPIDDRLFTRVRELISEVKWPGIAVVKTEKKITLTVPQSAMFLNETPALTSGGATLIQNFLILPNLRVQKNRYYILQRPLVQEEDELNLKRSNTIGKLMIAYGLTCSCANYGTRSYQFEIDSKNIQQGNRNNHQTE